MAQRTLNRWQLGVDHVRMGRGSVACSNLRRVLGCAALSVVPIVALGFVLAASYRTEAKRRGLAEAQSEARLVARTAIEPSLTGHVLASQLTKTESLALRGR